VTHERGELLLERAGHRRTLQRMVLSYGTLTAIAVALLLGLALPGLIGGNGGAVVSSALLALFAGLFFHQAWGAWRDLRAAPMETRGTVRRMWSKGTLLWLFRSHYLHVECQIFDVPVHAWADLREGDVVLLEHWPRTRHVIAVRRLESAPTPPVPPPRTRIPGVRERGPRLRR
jgi:hypothetical protein